LFVAHLFHPVDDLTVELFLNGDMRHGRGRRGIMPMCRVDFSSQNALSCLSSQFIKNLYRMKTIRLTETIKLFRALGPLLAMTLVAGLVWNPASASCAQIRIEITATVSLIDDPDNLLNNAVAPGDTVTGIYTYSSAVDSNPLEQVGD